MPPTYANALGTAGLASGLGLAQGLGSLIDAPRRMLWQGLNAAGLDIGEDASDFAQRMGLDPESLSGMIVGNAAEMLLDPLNVAGPIAGGVGRMLGTGLDVSKAAGAFKGNLAKSLAALTGERMAAGEVGTLAKALNEAPQAFKNWPPPNSPMWNVPSNEQFVEALAPKAARGTELSTRSLMGLAPTKAPAAVDPATFLAEAAAPDLATLGRGYNRASPAAVAALEQSGSGVGRQAGQAFEPGFGKGAVMTMGERPSFLRGKGGSMQFDPTYHAPQYGASFQDPTFVRQALGEGKAASLADRLGQESASLLDAPLADVERLATDRFARLDPQIDLLTGRLREAEEMIPFNISENPRISEQLAGQMANLHALGVSSLGIPGLMSPLRPAPAPSEYEQLSVMPQDMTEVAPMPTAVYPGYDDERRRQLRQMQIMPKR